MAARKERSQQIWGVGILRMVGSEVDQKYMGTFARTTAGFNATLSAGLYKLLGLSTLLSRKLLRARKQRKLDTSRDTKSLDLYRHIIWMARQGLTILQNEIQPEMANYAGPKYASLNELRVLVAKLNASFLHIFVLFDHAYQARTATPPQVPKAANGVNGTAHLNGLLGVNGVSAINSSYAYITPTLDAFSRAEGCARELLPGSHPLRLSVKLEYSAFLYDCTKDYENARNVAQRAVDEAVASMDVMPDDDEAFEDYMELVGSLGVIAKRGEPSPRPSPRMNDYIDDLANGHVI
ncbi:14-3-3 protein [Tuber magnatum]|uniref:14-3-3 protein n=1 Tax=Tuber magnatum TaxID=42249 RepID=A0A317SU92_9PEZI|nr:14-3-3 protein [Tuber magnatum]